MAILACDSCGISIPASLTIAVENLWQEEERFFQEQKTTNCVLETTSVSKQLPEVGSKPWCGMQSEE